MQYKNECIIIQDNNNCRINEAFNEWLQVDEYYIIDIDQLAQELGQEIMKEFENTNDKCTWENISAFVENALDNIRADLQYSVEEYLCNNWE